jgi:hypothetical protein
MSLEFYDVLEVKTADSSGRGDSWRTGSHPVMTMFFSSGADTGDMEPEVHLTCLRTIPYKSDASATDRALLETVPRLSIWAGVLVWLLSL